MKNKKPKIGFIGQGFIGKNYADDFEKRGYKVVRYAKEAPYSNLENLENLKRCDMVFVAVPTPTTPKGYDASILKKVIPLAKKGSIVILKSTIYPGLTKKFQKEFPDKIIFHSPEFLSEKTAAHDAQHPFINIIGIPTNSAKHKRAAKLVLSVLPKAPYSDIVSSEEAELIKYCHNCSGYTQIIFFNLMYDLAKKLGADWTKIEGAIRADPFVPNRYASPVHKKGRGAGGHCFIKDFAALRRKYEEIMGDPFGLEVMKKMEKKNTKLLRDSKKDIYLLEGVYGNKI